MRFKAAIMSADEEVKCGRLTKSNKPCNWGAGQCPFHSKCEGLDMAREDKLSQKMNKGLCGAL